MSDPSTLKSAKKQLHEAALRGDISAASLALSHGAYDFKTAYMNACENGDEDIRKYIFGATIQYLKGVNDNRGDTGASSWSRRYMDDLVAYGLMGACKGGHLDRIGVYLGDPTVRLYVECMCQCCSVDPNINVVLKIVKHATQRLTVTHILCETPGCDHLRDPDIATILLPLLEKIV